MITITDLHKIYIIHKKQQTVTLTAILFAVFCIKNRILFYFTVQVKTIFMFSLGKYTKSEINARFRKDFDWGDNQKESYPHSGHDSQTGNCFD